MAKRQVAKKARKTAKKKTASKTAKKKKTSKTAKKTKTSKATNKKKTPTAKSKKPAKRSKTKAPWAAAQLQEFKALERRATTLGKSLTDADFDANGDPVNPAWSGLLRDLDAWAAKYGVRLSKKEHDHADGGDGAGAVPMIARGACPGSFQTKPTYHTTLPNGTVLMEQTSCILKRRTLFGRCVYSCTDGIYSV